MSKILVTGIAGFIGFHLSQNLLNQGDEVIGVDNLNSYYDIALKKARLKQLKTHQNLTFYHLELGNKEKVSQLFKEHQIDYVLHLAAQAGVRYSLQNPHAYVDSNLVSFVNILEGCRHHQIKHLVFASSSSVYGINQKIPFAVGDKVDQPISLYAATKRSNELMAYSYSHLFNLPTTGLRFFTVYGPWGRPDMAYFLFTKSILSGQPINIFNQGKLQRDFTYIDDIVEGVIKVMNKTPCISLQSQENVNDLSKSAPYKIYNIGNNQPVELIRFIEILEECLGKKAIKNFLPMQPGDVPITYADIDSLIEDVGFKPTVSLEIGLKNFVAWYQSYYDH